jgi:hypothetical protein
MSFRNVFCNPPWARPRPVSTFQTRLESTIAAVGQAGSKATRRELCAGLIAFVAADENLMSALRHIDCSGGQAVGVDGLRPSAMSTSEQWAYVREIRDVLIGGQYTQRALKRAAIPKRPGSQDKRTIYIQTLADRVVSRAIAQIIGPVLELSADDFSYARCGRGAKYAIASASYLAQEEGRTVWIVEDLANAFDRVPRPKLAEILYRAIPNRELCDLTLELAKAPAKHGILQGASVSSLLLNIYLDRTLHRRWRERQPHVPLLRYVDDLVIAANPDDDLEDCYHSLADLTTAAGFELKHGPADAMRDLSHKDAEWLGYLFAVDDNRLSLRPACYCSDDPKDIDAHSVQLRAQFLQLHERPNAWRFVAAVVRGHVEHLAPSYMDVDRQSISRQIHEAAMDAGFGVLGGEEWIEKCWETAYGRYLQMTAAAERQMATCRERTLSSVC